ncbi:MAG: response regulator [Lachnospiraceae bacterium]|nr:response regulator [Lachnospiraceae bacterium]
MTEKNIIVKIVEILDRKENVRADMSVLLDELYKEGGLRRVALFEADYSRYICSRFFDWKKKAGGTGSSLFQSPSRILAGKDMILSRQDARLMRETLSGRNYILLNENTDTRIRNLFLGIVGDFSVNSIIAPLVSGGVQVGFMLFDEGGGPEPSTEGIDFYIIVSKIVGAYYNSQRSNAENKMKSEFLSRMSHEIRTPMNAIIGMTDIAIRKLDDIDRVSDCLSKISTSTHYLLNLINEILDMSKIESGKMELGLDRFRMDSVLDGIETLLTPQAKEKGINLKTIREYRDAWLVGDELKVSQILINLVGNALKFTPSGGKIIVRVEEMLSEDDCIVLRFLVKDTGIGIAPKDIGRIFRAFEQADSHTSGMYGGTGLGLSISYGLVKLMGGELLVTSTVGKGSDFYFTLSFKQADEDKAQNQENGLEAEEDRGEEYRFDGMRVLIVEDNELNAEIAETVLDMAGFTTETAQDGKAAVEKFTSNPDGYYDVILMDIRMPVMDGLEATRLIRSSGLPYSDKVPIIAMTANAFDEDMKKSLKSGMDGHLSKPVDTQKLFEEITRVLSYRSGNGETTSEGKA